MLLSVKDRFQCKFVIILLSGITQKHFFEKAKKIIETNCELNRSNCIR